MYNKFTIAQLKFTYVNYETSFKPLSPCTLLNKQLKTVFIFMHKLFIANSLSVIGTIRQKCLEPYLCYRKCPLGCSTIAVIFALWLLQLRANFQFSFEIATWWWCIIRQFFFFWGGGHASYWLLSTAYRYTVTSKLIHSLWMFSHKNFLWVITP